MKKRIPPDRRLYLGVSDRSEAYARSLIRSIAGRVGGTQRDVLFPLFFPPSITSVTPTGGFNAGGIQADIAGANFKPGATVLFGATPATVNSNSPTHLLVTVPAHAAGVVSITVTNTDGQSATRASAYTYATPVVAVGSSGPGSGFAASAIDGTTWINRAIPAGDYHGLVATPTLYVATGRFICTTSNGIDWTQRYDVGLGFQISAPIGYRPSDGLLVANWNNSHILRSTDAINWQDSVPSGPSVFGAGVFYSPSLAKFVLFGTGGGLARTSNDGIAWSAGVSPAGNIVEAADNGAGLLIGVDGSRSIYTSADGLNWTQAFNKLATVVGSITYSPVAGRFVAVGATSAYWTTDGVTWTAAASGAGTRVAWCPAFGNVQSISSTTIRTSTDGNTWANGSIPAVAWTAVISG